LSLNVEVSTLQTGAVPYEVDDNRRLRRLRLLAPDNDKLLVFVHGLFSGYLTQWHGFHKDLESRTVGSLLAGWNIAFLGYDSTRIKTFGDIARIIGTECRSASKGYKKEGKSHRTFAFVGFSLGTLGIRQYLADCDLHPADCTVRSVTLLGAPLYGSLFASVAAELYPGRILDQLSIGSATIAMLENWSRCAFASHPWPKNSLYFGVHDGVVSLGSQNLNPWNTDATPPEYLNAGHTMECLVASGVSGELYRILESQLA
jgi:hypothetical protein